MANYETLKAAIQQVVKTNGNNEITGALLQQSLLAMINSLGSGYQFVDVATSATKPGTPDQKVFYIANGKGTYPNFGGISITEDEVVILHYDTDWHKLLTGIASNEKLSELESEIGDINGYAKPINPYSYELVNGIVALSDGKWYIPGANFQTLVIPNQYKGATISFNDSNSIAKICFVVELNRVEGQSPIYCQGEIGVHGNGTYQIPADCNYILVYAIASNIDRRPDITISADKIGEIEHIADAISKIDTRMTNVEDIIDNIYINDYWNILDPSKCVENKTVLWVNDFGLDITSLTDASGYAISEVIDVKEGEWYIMNNAYNTSIFFSKSTSTSAISENIVSGEPFQVPSGMTKMRYRFTINNKPNWRDEVMLIKGKELPQFFVPYSDVQPVSPIFAKKEDLLKEIEIREESFEQLKDTIESNNILIENVLNPDVCVKDLWPGNKGDNISDNVAGSGHITTDIINVKPGDKYIFNNKGWSNNIWFADNNNIIVEQRELESNIPFTIPEGVYKMRYSFTYPTIWDNRWKNTAMLIKGEYMPNDYVEYGKKFISGDIKVIPESQKIETFNDGKCYIVLSFDGSEAMPNYFEHRKAIVDEYGFKVVTTIAPAHFNGDFDDWKSNEERTHYQMLLKSGFDVGFYPSITDIVDGVEVKSEEEWVSWITNANTKMENLGIANIVAWHCSGTKMGPNLYNALKKTGYKVGRAETGQYMCGDTVFQKFKKDTDFLAVAATSLRNDGTFEGYKSDIDTAIKEHSCLTLLTHLILPDDSPSIEDYNVRETLARQVFAYIKEKVDDGLVEVITYRELFNIISPKLGYENDYNRLLKLSL